MPYFDNNVALYPENNSSIQAYNSYMCPSRGEYLIKDYDKPECNKKHINKPIWVRPESKYTHQQIVQQNISKLRNILSETIASITKENHLKKGESVELTLEIEMMNSVENTPTNSLVEVTIIQHNSKFGASNRTNKLQFHIGDQHSTCESTPQKQKSWFKRVISREHAVNNLSKELKYTANSQKEYHLKRKHSLKPLTQLKVNRRFHKVNHTENIDTRSNFINVLPEDTIYYQNVPKEYQKVSQSKNKVGTAEDMSTSKIIPEKLNKTTSLMKKISEIILPPKKVSKNEVVKSALSALKIEIDNMKTAIESNENKESYRKKNKAPIHNLGKLVNNILFDVMASVDGDNNEIKEEITLPLQYQSFFEPVMKTTKKQKVKRLTKRKTGPSTKKLYRSHSDTCCIKPLKIEINPNLKISNSIGDCKANLKTKRQPEAEYVGDMKQTYKKKMNSSNQRDLLKCQNKTMKGGGKFLSNPKTENKLRKYFTNQRPPHSRSTLIEWNGKFVKVSKDIKARIEMLIVNELENLALKEGMECDVTALPSSDDTSKYSHTVDKISSFICELDISDKNVRKIMKSKKSLHKKVNIYHSPININQPDKNTCKHKERTCTLKKYSGSQTMPSLRKEGHVINKLHTLDDQNTTNKKNNNQIICNDGTSEVQHNDGIEVKYMNENVRNWSAESLTVILHSPQVNNSKQNNTVCRKIQCSECDETKNKNNNTSTGFIKVIKSDDSTWNKCYTQSDMARRNQKLSVENLTESNTNTTEKLSSKTSNEFDSSIEIELDIKDLEYILKEAKQNYNADKVLIEAKCLRPPKQHKSLKFAGKNSPNYTNQLLTSAAKRLEKYAKTKPRNKTSKK